MQMKHVISEARNSRPTNEILYYYYIISRTVYVVPVNVECSYQVYFSGFHCGKLINNFIKITRFHLIGLIVHNKKLAARE